MWYTVVYCSVLYWYTVIYCDAVTHLKLIKAEEVGLRSNIPSNRANGVVGMRLLSPRGLGKRLLELVNP